MKADRLGSNNLKNQYKFIASMNPQVKRYQIAVQTTMKSEKIVIKKIHYNNNKNIELSLHT